MRTSKATEYQDFLVALRTKVLSGGCWCHCGHYTKLKINSNTFLGVWVGPKGGVVVSCMVPRISGINVQLLYGVRFKLA